MSASGQSLPPSSGDTTLPDTRFQSIAQRIELPGLALVGELPDESSSEGEASSRTHPPPVPLLPDGPTTPPHPLETTGPTVSHQSDSAGTAAILGRDRGATESRQRSLESSALARRLLDEERLVTADRFVRRADDTAHLRFLALGASGAAFLLLLVVAIGVLTWALLTPNPPAPTPTAQIEPPAAAAPVKPAPVQAVTGTPLAPAPAEPAAAPSPEVAAEVAGVAPSKPEPTPPAPPRPAPPPPPAAKPKPAPKPVPAPAPAPPVPAPAPAREPDVGSDLVDPWK